MFFISLSIILFSVVLCGWGVLLFKLLGYKSENRNPFLLFFVGYGVSIILIDYVSFFVKLDGKVLAIVVISGMLSFIFLLKKNKTNIPKVIWISFFLVSLLILFEIVVSIGGKAYPTVGDTTGYHLGIVSWLNSYPLVPGIANLHFRLGNHSGYLQLAAVMDNYKWDMQSPLIMPGLFFFSYFMYFIWEMVFVLAEKIKKIKLIIWNIFYGAPVLMVGSFYYFSTFNSAPNLYYDILPMFLAAIIVNEVVKYFLNEQQQKNINLLQFIFVANLLSTAAYLSKQNAALVVLIVIVLSIHLLFINKLLNVKNLLILFILPLLGFLGSVISNLITSGYPLFPLPMIYFNLPWTASADSVNQAYDAVKYWAKLPGADYMNVADHGFSYWFFPWIKRNMADKLFIDFVMSPLIGGLAIWFVGIIFCIKKKKKYYWLFFAVILNLLYWFLLAPDIRFGILFFAILFASGLAIFALFLSEIYYNIIFKTVSRYNLVLATLIVGFISIWSYNISKTGELKTTLTADKYFYVNVVEKNEFYEEVMKTKDDGVVTVRKPKDGECRSALLCTPLFDTPYYPKNIKAFSSKNLRDGFYLEKIQ